MFNQPQQLQQQLLQLQHLLQPQPPPPSRGMTPSQQQQMLTLRGTNQASLLSANPMLQRAWLMQQMQGNLRSFNMAAAPVLQQFFPQATRQSLLGPPPVGVSLKPTRLTFPGLPFQQQSRVFRKDFLRVPERKREADSALSSSSSSQPALEADETLPVLEASAVEAEPSWPSSSPSDTVTESSSPDGEPSAKRLKSGGEDSVPADAKCTQQVEGISVDSQEREVDHEKENTAAETSKEPNFPEEPKTSEVVTSAGSLKVTIQQSSESRAISTVALKPAHWTSEMGAAETSAESALKFYCYICKTNCCNQENFQIHMAGAEHQQRLQEIQHMSNICFVSLLPVMKERRPLVEKDKESQLRWCNMCQINFTGDLIKHRRTQEHKLAKCSLRPFCTVCSRYFKTPRKFVEHIKSLEHKKKAKEVKLGEKEQGGPEDSEELITVDAVGCFEDEDDEDEDEEIGQEEDSVAGQQDAEEPVSKQFGFKEVCSEEAEGSEKYCPDTVYGPDFLVPVAGFLCRLCHKFCHSDSAARLTHCKSLMHFENFQRYKATRLQTAVFAEGSLCSRQGLRDQQIPPPTVVDKTDAGTDAQAFIAANEADCNSSNEEDNSTTLPDNSAATKAEAIHASLDGEGEKSIFSTLHEGSLLQDAPLRQKEHAAKPKGGAGSVSGEIEEVRANNAASGARDLETSAASSALAKEAASAGCRRSARHRTR